MSVLWQQRTHGVQRRKEQHNRTLALLFLLAIVVLTVLAAAYLSLAAANVRLSNQVWQMEETLMTWERENQVLMVEIARLNSIPVLQERAIELGYVPADAVEYLDIKGP